MADSVILENFGIVVGYLKGDRLPPALASTQLCSRCAVLLASHRPGKADADFDRQLYTDVVSFAFGSAVDCQIDVAAFFKTDVVAFPSKCHAEVVKRAQMRRSRWCDGCGQMINAAVAREATTTALAGCDAGGRGALLRQVGLFAPVRHEQDAVDVLEVDGFGAVAHGFEQRSEAQVSGLA